jgi:hypothetical protein
VREDHAPGAWAKFVVVAVDGAGRKGAAWRGRLDWIGVLEGETHERAGERNMIPSLPLPPDSPSLPASERERRRARAASELEVGGRPPADEEEGGIEMAGWGWARRGVRTDACYKAAV